MNLGKKRDRSFRTIHGRLVGLVLAGVVPVGIALGVLVFTSYQERRGALCRHMLETARSLSLVMDLELAGVHASVQTLATTPLIASADYAGFYAQAQRVLPNYPEADIILADGAGQQVFNSAVPPGSPLPKRNVPDRVREALAAGKPSVSDLYRGAFSGRLLISIDVPVMRDGGMAYDLAITLPADNLLAALALPSLPPELTATILDGNDTVVARTQDQERFVGQRAETPVLLQRLKTAPEGVVQATGLAGGPVVMGYHRSAGTGWTMVVSVPEAAMLRDLWRWLAWTLGGAVLLAGLGVGTALRLGNKIAASIKALVAPAMALGRGEAVSVGGLDFTETQEVAASLVKASDLLTQREQALRENEARAGQRAAVLDATLDAIAEGLIVVGPDRHILRMNQVAQEVFGYSAEAARLPVDKRLAGVTITNDKGKAVSPEELPGFRALSGSAVNDEVLRVQAPDAAPFWALFNAAPIRDPSGAIMGAVATFLDITERKRAEELHDRIESIIRHDLRTPAISALSLAGILQGDANLTQEQRQLIGLFEQAGKNMLDTLDSSLILYKLETGQYQFETEAFDCADAVLEILELLTKHAQFAAVRSKVVGDGRQAGPACRCPCRGERKLLQLALQNLLVNAFEASPPGAEVVVALSSGEDCRIDIRNRGAVPKEIRDRFFEKYVTHGKRKGTGLGTYAAKMMLEVQGGSVAMRASDADDETVVTVRMPC